MLISRLKTAYFSQVISKNPTLGSLPFPARLQSLSLYATASKIASG